MTHEHRHVRRVHVHLPAPDAPNDDGRFVRRLGGHTGVFSAAASTDGRRLIIDYDPELIRLADLAAIVRLGGRPVANRDT